ncbi:MAG: hypothetical protein M1825_006414 [Sarcosagium campestre]|nr:MAG: hypothetical protein M1825_006414 [Sarcosagium campestre]
MRIHHFSNQLLALCLFPLLSCSGSAHPPAPAEGLATSESVSAENGGLIPALLGYRSTRKGPSLSGRSRTVILNSRPRPLPRDRSYVSDEDSWLHVLADVLVRSALITRSETVNLRKEPSPNIYYPGLGILLSRDIWEYDMFFDVKKPNSAEEEDFGVSTRHGVPLKLPYVEYGTPELLSPKFLLRRLTNRLYPPHSDSEATYTLRYYVFSSKAMTVKPVLCYLARKLVVEELESSDDDDDAHEPGDAYYYEYKFSLKDVAPVKVRDSIFQHMVLDFIGSGSAPPYRDQPGLWVRIYFQIFLDTPLLSFAAGPDSRGTISADVSFIEIPSNLEDNSIYEMADSPPSTP